MIPTPFFPRDCVAPEAISHGFHSFPFALRGHNRAERPEFPTVRRSSATKTFSQT